MSFTIATQQAILLASQEPMNMVFLMKSIALGKEQFGLPEKEPRKATHFIR